MRKTTSCVLALLAIWIALPVVMLAHHGTNISYDRTTVISLKGVVKEFWYKNPHPALFVDVTDKDGTTKRWTIEIAPTPYSLARAGWTKKRAEDALKAGTPLNLNIYASRAGTPSGLLQKVTNEEGLEIFGGASANEYIDRRRAASRISDDERRAEQSAVNWPEGVELGIPGGGARSRAAAGEAG